MCGYEGIPLPVIGFLIGTESLLDGGGGGMRGSISHLWLSEERKDEIGAGL